MLSRFQIILVPVISSFCPLDTHSFTGGAETIQNSNKQTKKKTEIKNKCIREQKSPKAEKIFSPLFLLRLGLTEVKCEEFLLKKKKKRKEIKADVEIVQRFVHPWIWRPLKCVLVTIKSVKEKMLTLFFHCIADRTPGHCGVYLKFSIASFFLLFGGQFLQILQKYAQRPSEKKVQPTPRSSLALAGRSLKLNRSVKSGNCCAKTASEVPLKKYLAWMHLFFEKNLI